jgi:Ser/Thr protein kinase RdoA (MazF antagonist)
MTPLTQQTDPLAVIAEAAPAFDAAEAVELLQEHYGLDATVSVLVSERDQNFRVRTGSGAAYVLKIANAAELAQVTDFQIQALLHVARVTRQNNIPINAPEVLLTVDGKTHINLESSGGTHVARVVSFLAGIPLAERIASPALARNMGAYLAHLGHALTGFSHPGSAQSLLWDMQQALNLRQLLEYVEDENIASATGDALDDFETFALPALAGMRSQIVHSDFNADNVLVEATDPDKVAGVIDFGDMLHAPLVADVAIGASYLRAPVGDPLRLIAEFVAGYHSVEPLEIAETDILLELIQARLCASITILDWRAAVRGADDPYLEKLVKGEASAGRFLCRLREIPRESARQLFRQVCASAVLRQPWS